MISIYLRTTLYVPLKNNIHYDFLYFQIVCRVCNCALSRVSPTLYLEFPEIGSRLLLFRISIMENIWMDE